MHTVTSTDGTTIAFDRFGSGHPVVVVGGATCDRAMTRPLAKELGKRFQAINYDRRGRGGSGDTTPYAVEREIEDIGALIAAAGGAASIYGHSSGAALALHAAASDLPITKVVLHEPPFAAAGEQSGRAQRDYARKLDRLLAEGRRGDAMALFMTTAGYPQEDVDELRRQPRWAELEAVAPTLAYESAVMRDREGGAIPYDLIAKVTAPTLVICGGDSPQWMISVGKRIADAIENGRQRVLAGEEHVVAPEKLAPVLAEFLANDG